MNEKSVSARRYRTEFSSTEGWRLRKALAGKVQDGPYFLRRDVENLRDLVDRHTGLKIFEHRLNRHPRSTEYPRAAYLAGDALHGGALRPIETCHLVTPSLGY